MDIIINSIEFIEVVWYNSRTCVGIVLCKDRTTNEYKVYIGAGTGEDEVVDVSNIMMWGSKFPIELAKPMFPILK